MTSKATVLAQIEDATSGFDALLDNRLLEAFDVLRAQPESPFHLVGLGIAAFLKAILSREDTELREATETLVKAETVATAEVNAKRPKGDRTGAYPAGIEYKLLQADAVLGQALVAVMSESYVEFAKAVWKLNKAYKILTSLHKTVFPGGIGEDESLDSVFRKLNEHYLAQTTAAADAAADSGSGGGGFFSGWVRKRAPAGAGAVGGSLRTSSSSSALSTTAATSSLRNNAAATTPRPGTHRLPSASAPGSHLGSEHASTADLLTQELAQTNLGPAAGSPPAPAVNDDDDDDAEAAEHPPPLWAGDRLTTTVISGAALGSGMFGLIFSMMPPRMVKLISWFGFAGSSRPAALKLLAVSAATGDDVHGYFASLTLVTFYGFILLMSGWQSSEQTYLRTLSRTLGRVRSRFPNGTLWVLNRAKLARYRRDPDEAVRILIEALAREQKPGNSFREADSLLVFELGWLYLSQAKWVETADTFEKMCGLNSWSHATYIAIAAGALIDAINTQRLASPPPTMTTTTTTSPEDLSTRAQALLDRLPSLCLQKRVFGEKPVTETFIVRRAEAHKLKRERWIARGRIPPTAGGWEVVRITSAMELGLVWASVGGRSPLSGLRAQIDLLSSFHPHPRLPGTTTPASRTPSSRTPSIRSTSNSVGSATPSTTATSATQMSKWGIDPLTSDLDTPGEILIRDLLLGALYAALAHHEPPQSQPADPQETDHLGTATHLLDGVLAASETDVGEEKWAVAFAAWHRAVVELHAGDLAAPAAAAGTATGESKDAWAARAKRVEGWLARILAMGEYDMKTRLESRVLMLRDEISMRKAKLGIK